MPFQRDSMRTDFPSFEKWNESILVGEVSGKVVACVERTSKIIMIFHQNKILRLVLHRYYMCT